MLNRWNFLKTGFYEGIKPDFDASHPEQCGLKSFDQRNKIMIATMIATRGAAMMKSFKGLFTMDRSMPNLVPSGTKYMWHFGHFPELG